MLNLDVIVETFLRFGGVIALELNKIKKTWTLDKLEGTNHKEAGREWMDKRERGQGMVTEIFSKIHRSLHSLRKDGPLQKNCPFAQLLSKWLCKSSKLETVLTTYYSSILFGIIFCLFTFEVLRVHFLVIPTPGFRTESLFTLFTGKGFLNLKGYFRYFMNHV